MKWAWFILRGRGEGLWAGTQFAILGFSHRLSLKLTRRAGLWGVLTSPCLRDVEFGEVARFRRAA